MTFLVCWCKIKCIHSDGFLSDFCCGNLILLRNRFYGYSFLFFHLHFTICIYLKDKKYGILYYGISNKSCFSINHNITNINQYNIIHSNYISLVQNKEPSVHYLPIITKISIALTSEMSSLSYAFLFSCNENKCQKLIRCNQR